MSVRVYGLHQSFNSMWEEYKLERLVSSYQPFFWSWIRPAELFPWKDPLNSFHISALWRKCNKFKCLKKEIILLKPADVLFSVWTEDVHIITIVPTSPHFIQHVVCLRHAWSKLMPLYIKPVYSVSWSWAVQTWPDCWKWSKNLCSQRILCFLSFLAFVSAKYSVYHNEPLE